MSAARADPFGDISRRFIDEGFFRGVVLRVERFGRLLFEGAWGNALYTAPERIPMEASTLFDLASVSKLFTTTAVLKLVSLGKLALRDPVGDLLDEGHTARLKSLLAGLDVASLLTHSSGLRPWFPFYTRSRERFETILADLLAEQPPVRRVIYSDLNFMLLGRIVEGTARLPLPAAIAALVLRPLGLDRTSYGPPLGPAAATEFGNRIERAMVADLGLDFGGWRDESKPIRGEANDGNCHYYFKGAAGHAGIYSDARDLCRLGRLFLEGGRVDGAAWLIPGLAEEAMRDHGGSRGLGFQLGDNYPGGGCGHTGFTGTCLHVNEPSGVVIAILANRLHVPEPRDINPFRQDLCRAVLSAYAPGRQEC